MSDLSDRDSRHTHSYLVLRKAVGWIGILLPFTLLFGDLLIFRGESIQRSISYYYHTGMGDVFVGACCALALFLFFYSGHDKWDDWAGNMAGLFALGVAWFPTTVEGSNEMAGKIHTTCAIFFFLTLVFFSLFLFTRKGPDPTPQKLIRNKIHLVCGIIMLACLISIWVFFGYFLDDNPGSSFVFWAETGVLVAFGVSWLTKGGMLCPDK